MYQIFRIFRDSIQALLPSSANLKKLKALKRVHIGHAIKLVWSSTPRWSLISLGLVVFQGVLPLASLYLLKLIINAVEANVLSSRPEAVFFKEVSWLIAIAALLALLGSFSQTLSRVINEVQAQIVTDRVHEMLQAKSTEVDLEYYENSQYYDTLHRAQQDAPFRPTQILLNLVHANQNGISLLAMMGLLLSLHWGIAMILLVAALPGVLLRFQHAHELHRWLNKCSLTERRANYLNWMLTGNQNAREIRLFNLGPFFRQKFRDLRYPLRQEKVEIAMRRSRADFITQVSSTLAVFGSFAFIAYRTVQGIITLGDLVIYYQAFQRAQGFLKGFLHSISGLYENGLFLSSLYEFLDLQPKVADPPSPQLFPQPIQRGIVVDQVGFQYTGSARRALRDVSLTIHPGEIIALVGENGSGKTTLIKLLCRLYDPTEGRILIDGIDLRQFKTTDLRQHISVVLQDFIWYQLKAWENIWLGNVEKLPDRDKIEYAAHQSGAAEVIEQLPKGYETQLGRYFEGGEDLSVGQWQKIALARAFLREAQLIILDEPTSALDARAEAKVFERFRQLIKDRSAILISHRLSSVKMADRIYVLKDQTIVESGTHDQLMQQAGTYQHLFDMQARHYR